MPPAISVSGLVKTFGHVRALDGLDLEVATGEVHGFLGPNGAGKSTTIRVLLGLLRADSGEATLLGGDPWRDAVALHRRLAYVPGDVNLWPNLTGGEVIDLLGRLRGGLDRARRDALLERFELDPTKKGRTYSKGNRQKVALVAALASDAELLHPRRAHLGPRPADGGRSSRTRSARSTDDGRTVLLSSHILAEVEALCDRVDDHPRRPHRRARHAGRAAPPHPHGDLGRDRATRHRARRPARGPRRRSSTAAEPTFDVDTAQLDGALEHLSGFGIRTLTSQPPTLEELFLRHYGDELALLEGTDLDGTDLERRGR